MAKAAVVETNGHGHGHQTNGSHHHQTPHSRAELFLPEQKVRFIPLSYKGDHGGGDADRSSSNASALALVQALRPEWGTEIEFKRFTDGITNTLLQARPPKTAAQPKAGETVEEAQNREAILLRAYGNGTDLLIDRGREAQNHELLSRHHLAPELLALFENGMLYRFIRGRVTTPQDLRRPDIYRAVARRLAEWHSTVPCLPGTPTTSSHSTGADADKIRSVAPGKPTPNVWTVMQKWILALPTDKPSQRERQASLQKELDALVEELSQRPGLGRDGLVFAHCDLLSGNVIILPSEQTVEGHANGNGAANGTNGTNGSHELCVTFIDYEYATPSPAAFDLANHFAEWGGFDCDFSVLPTRSQRREFIREYVQSYFGSLPRTGAVADAADDEAADRLFAEVDLFRGVPGFYWGIWALIQATISEIDFDYASYAETRLGEYWAWRAEQDGTRAAAGKEMPLRERRWAQEE